ncbi:MAG: DUF885 family protein, partial [Arenimonas sp.]
MLRNSALLVLALLVTACSPQPPAKSARAAVASAPSTADTQFNALSARWLDGAMHLSPVSATQVGDHRFDAEIDDLSADGRAKSLQFSKTQLAELEKIDRSTLSRDNQVDASVLRNQLRYDVWTAETLQSWAWDPMIYSQLAGSTLYTLMARDFAPMPKRLGNAITRMEKLPTLFAQMRANLDPARVPKIHAETVAKQNKGVLSLVDELIVPHGGELSAADHQRLDAAIAGLRKAVAEHQTWLDKTLVPNAKGDFRIGQKLYDEKLAFALDSPLTRAEIRQRAEAEIVRVRSEMYSVARDVLGKQKGAPPTAETPSPEQQQ